MPKGIVKDALNNLGSKLDAIFASLPRTRVLNLEHFYANKLRVLKMSEGTRKKLREKEVRGSASHGVSEENEPQSSETERFSWGTFPK